MGQDQGSHRREGLTDGCLPKVQPVSTASDRTCECRSWAIGVEEQFYLVWPVLLVLFPRRRSWILFHSHWSLAQVLSPDTDQEFSTNDRHETGFVEGQAHIDGVDGFPVHFDRHGSRHVREFLRALR